MSCKYCGRIHKVGASCQAQKTIRRTKANTRAVKFRSTYNWARKREAIKERDHYLCQWCLQKHIINCGLLEVHHICPLEECYNLRLEDENLITLCVADHKKAEAGEISKEELQKIIAQSALPPHPCSLSPNENVNTTVAEAFTYDL